MDNLLIYLLKVSAGTSLLYLCYLLLFRKDTFYLRNRIFLILTLLLPTLLPFLKIPILSSDIVASAPTITLENIHSSGSSLEKTMAVTIQSGAFNYNIILVWMYFTVTGLLLIRIAISLVSTFRIIKKGTIEKGQFPKIIISGEFLPPFSFFPYAVIPAEDYKSGNYNDIIDHEFAHLRQGHTFDLLLSELFIAFQWFNPFIWFIKRSIILNHEYLADHVSISNNKSIKEYQYRLLNFQTGLKNISLAHTFNSLIKNRIIMINKKPTRKLATIKNVLILPVVAFVVYAFATPEYHYVAPDSNPFSASQAPPIMQKEVKGIVKDEDGKPLEGVNIFCTGTIGYAKGTSTDSDGRFKLYDIEEDAYLSFFAPGFKSYSVKADFNSEMVIKMTKDPDYIEPKVRFSGQDGVPLKNPITVVDGVISNEPPAVINSKLGNEIGKIINLSVKEATAKYGEAGKNGATEIYTRKKAAEMGIKIPFRREGPDDFPTFQGKRMVTFNDWVVSQLEYPPDAVSQKLQGRITVNFTIEPDGSVDNIKLLGSANQILGNAVIKAIQSSPKWDPPKNPDAKDPFISTASFKFELPGKISKDDTYIAVEEMPQYPGGDGALLDFIKSNTNYPEEAKAGKIQGRVILRFIVNKEGNAEEPIVIKGVDPILDAEAIRVVSLLKGFTPGTNGGKPVNVYYMVPVNFSLEEDKPSK
jgi:TonB family protein